MDADKEQKQTFLRVQILEKGYDAEEFIYFMNEKLSIGDNLDLCSFAQLKEVVQEFQAIKNPPAEDDTNNDYSEDSNSLPIQSSVAELKQSVTNIKPKQILFVLVFIIRPNQLLTFWSPSSAKPTNAKRSKTNSLMFKTSESSFQSKSFLIWSPERKNTGGFFGIGSTSFL